MKLNAEFKRLWSSVVVAFFGIGLCMPTIPLFGWGLFMRPLGQAYGWSLALTSSGLAVFTIAMAVVALPMGHLIDRFGPYRVLALSMPISCAAFAALALTNGSTARYYTLWGIVGVAGVGSSPVVWTRMLAERFREARGLALGIAACGGAAFLLLIKPLTQSIIDLAGWRAGIVFLGLLPLLLLYPLALLILRPAPAGRGAEASAVCAPAGYTFREVTGQWRFAILVCTAICGSAIPGMLPHLESVLASRGIAPAEAATMTSLMGGSLLLGRLAAGYLSDRIWSPGMFAAFLLLSGLSAFGLSVVSGWALLFICILGIGAASGGEFQLLAFVTSRYFGVRAYGATFGLLYGLTTGLGGLWSVAIGRLADLTGNYALPLRLVFGSLALVAALMCLMGRAPDWEDRA